MSRRCVTEVECHNIISWDPKKSGLRGKRLDNYNGRDICVLECPKNYTTGVRDGVDYCKPCDGNFIIFELHYMGMIFFAMKGSKKAM